MAGYKRSGEGDVFRARLMYKELIACLPTLDEFVPFPLASLLSGSSDSTQFLLGIEGKYKNMEYSFSGHRDYPSRFMTMVTASSGSLVCFVVHDSPLPDDEDYGPRSLVLFNPLTRQIVRREKLSPFTRSLSMSILQVRDASSSSDRCRLFVALMSERQYIPTCQIYDVEARTWRTFNTWKEWNYISDMIYDEYDDLPDLADDDPILPAEKITWKDPGGQDDDLRNADFLLYAWQGWHDRKHDVWALMGYYVATDSWMKAHVPFPNEEWAKVVLDWDYPGRNWTGLSEVWSWKGRVFLATSFQPNTKSGKLIRTLSSNLTATATASGFDVWELKARSDESKANKISAYFWDHISRTPWQLRSEMHQGQQNQCLLLGSHFKNSLAVME